VRFEISTYKNRHSLDAAAVCHLVTALATATADAPTHAFLAALGHPHGASEKTLL
jgi:hypothetical protein